jgi:hypothetical protein
MTSQIAGYLAAMLAKMTFRGSGNGRKLTLLSAKAAAPAQRFSKALGAGQKRWFVPTTRGLPDPKVPTAKDVHHHRAPLLPPIIVRTKANNFS